MTSADNKASSDSVRDSVRAGYAAIAEAGQFSGVQPGEKNAGSSCCGGGGNSGGGGCCGPTTITTDDLAAAIGYDTDELSKVPQGANMGLSCGNPTAIAALQPGEIVLDLGSGGGFDCFIAGPRVGRAGRVIGVDMTAEMISKARGNVAAYEKQSGLSNVEFRLGEIENLPAADSSVDVVISNCVLNLSPDKPRVWSEITRVLKPGGRVAVSDLALLKPLPESVRADLEALVGCVAGADLVDTIREDIERSGLTKARLVSKPEYIDSLVGSTDPLYERIASALPAGTGVADYVTSLDIEAEKPAAAKSCC